MTRNSIFFQRCDHDATEVLSGALDIRPALRRSLTCAVASGGPAGASPPSRPGRDADRHPQCVPGLRRRPSPRRGRWQPRGCEHVLGQRLFFLISVILKHFMLAPDAQYDSQAFL